MINKIKIKTPANIYFFYILYCSHLTWNSNMSVLVFNVIEAEEVEGYKI